MEQILNGLDKILSMFDPYSFHFINANNCWQRKPKSIFDKLSNELLFQLWREKQINQGENSFKLLLIAFYKEQSLKKIQLFLYSILSNQSLKETIPDEPEIESLFINEKNWCFYPSNHEARTDYALYFFQMVVYILQSAVYSRFETMFTQPWDTLRARMKNHFIQEKEMFEKNIRNLAGDDFWKEYLLQAKELLSKDEHGLFNSISNSVFEETIIDYCTQSYLQDFKESGNEDLFEIIIDQFYPSSAIISDISPGALYVSTKLLLDTSIPISSGIPYKAAEIIGILRDERSTSALIAAQKLFPLKYVHLHETIVYALGQLRVNKAKTVFLNILSGPDAISIKNPGKSYSESLIFLKEEAVWAIGRLPDVSFEDLSILKKCEVHSYSGMRLALAWALGNIAEKKLRLQQGIDLEIIRVLIDLLLDREKDVRLEAAYSLKVVGFSGFLDKLYLRDPGIVNILNLEPMKTCLEDIHSTLRYLIATSKQVVLAVTGDSGTGKTYFCQSLVEALRSVLGDRVLLLSRDNPADIEIFKQMLGISWLKKHQLESLALNYPVSENDDHPSDFFDAFIKRHRDKKIIILDGWRDEEFFDQIITIFYNKGLLNVILNLRTILSTRRLNLEEREKSLASTLEHLENVQGPQFEQTRIFQEGIVIAYDVDNSIHSRVNRDEMIQIFQGEYRKIKTDKIYVGQFEEDLKPLRLDREMLTLSVDSFTSRKSPFFLKQEYYFVPEEIFLYSIYNENTQFSPNLLQTIPLERFELAKLVYSRKGEIAGGTKDGRIVLFLRKECRFFVGPKLGSAVSGMAAVNNFIYSVHEDGSFVRTSFANRTYQVIKHFRSPATCLAGGVGNMLALGHADGTLRVCDVANGFCRSFRGGSSPITALNFDQNKAIFSADKDRLLRRWDIQSKKVTNFSGHKSIIRSIITYPDNRVVTGTENDDYFEELPKWIGGKVRIINQESGSVRIFHTLLDSCVCGLNVYFDGRIIVGNLGQPIALMENGNLIINDPHPDRLVHKHLSGHYEGTMGCITRGPEIISFGYEESGFQTIKVWGTKIYVQLELEKRRNCQEKARIKRQFV